jgi:digeranylgeranylglycerophospholipid reductase
VKRIETDVLVVGAGPGGSMAAKFAARGGMRTLLIEKRQEIGSPVRCAEGVSKDWMADCDVTFDPSWVACMPEGARIFSPNGTCAYVGAERAGNEVGVVLERHLFDKALARDAARAGAEILLKTHASDVLQSNGTVEGVVGRSMGKEIEIRAKIVIGADGFESQVGRWAGIRTQIKPRDVDATIQYRLCNIECDPRYCDFYVGSCAPGGYIWIFPKGEGVANVGIGVQLSLLSDKAEVKGFLDRWISRQPGLAQGQALEIVGGAVSTNKPLDRTVTDGVMLVGDAARLIDPLTGGGIVNACISGKLAGEVAAQAVRKGDRSARFLQKYEKAWRKLLEKKLLRNWMAKEKVGQLDDATFDSIVGTLAEVGTRANTLSLLIAIGKKHPRLVADFAELMFA